MTNSHQPVTEAAGGLFGSTTVTTILLLSGVLLLTLYFLKRRSKGKAPPGPTAWPLIGNLLEFRNDSSFVVFERYAKKYGPVFTVNFGPVPTVVLSDYASFKEAMITKSADFAGRYNLPSMDYITQGSKDIAFHDYDGEFKHLRKIAVHAIKEYLTGAQFDRSSQACSAQMLDELEISCGTPVNLKKSANQFIYNLLGTACWNKQFAKDDPSMVRLMDFATELATVVGNGFLTDLWGPLRVFEGKKWSVLKDALDVFYDKIIYKNLSEHEDTFDRENLRDLTDYLILSFGDMKEKDPVEFSWITREHVGQVLADVFSAGTDTTRETLYWWFLYMAGHQEVQEKAYREIVDQIGDKLPTKDDKKTMPYMEAMMQETMRAGVVAPTLIPHKATCDATLGGWDIEKGTMVIVNAKAIMNDPELWTKPEEFNPERFIKGDDHVEALIPFGAGKRVCVGQSIAKTELFITMTMFLQRFSIHLPEGVKANYIGTESLLGNFAVDYDVVLKKREAA